MKLDDAIEKRRSIRRFSSKKARWADVLEAIDAALKAPFAGNMNNLKFIIVESQESKNRLAECCQQDFVAEATFVIVVCSNSKQLNAKFQDRAQIYAKQHAGAAIENFLLKITDLKLACCWVGAYTDSQIKTELKIPKEMEIEAILPVGYAYKGTDAKRKVPKKESLEKVIHWGTWGTKKRPTSIKEPKTW